MRTDLWAPGKLASQLETARQWEADVVFGPVKLFGEPHRQRQYALEHYVLEGAPGVAKLIRRNHVPQSTVLAKRAALESVHGYDESLPISEDYDLWLRMLLDGCKFVYEPQAVTHYRILENSHSTNKSRMREGMRTTLARAELPTWSLRAQRYVRLLELYWSQRRHQWRRARER